MGLFTRSSPVPSALDAALASAAAVTAPPPVAPPVPAPASAAPAAGAAAPAAPDSATATAANTAPGKPAPLIQPAAPAPTAQDRQRTAYLQQLKVRIHQQLVERLDVQNMMTLPPETVRNEVRVVIRELCQSEKGLLNSADQERLMDDVMDETF